MSNSTEAVVQPSLVTSDAQKCFLESLPPELLEEIFRWVRLISEVEAIPLLANPPSRSLVSLVRRNLYHSLELTAPTFRKLCEHIGMTLELASYTKTLSITTPHGRTADEQRRLLDFFKSATSLVSLEIDDLDGIAEVLFSPRFVAHSYAALQSLTVRQGQFSAANPLAAQYRYLALLPHLRSFELLVMYSRESEPYALPSPQAREEQAFLESQAGALLGELSLESFALRGDISDRLAVDFMRTIRSITSLSLAHLSDFRGNLNDLLSAADSTNLTSLSISTLFHDAPLILDPAIGRFNELVTLSLPSNCHSQHFASSIARLSKLESISFVWPSTPDFAALESILTLPILPPSLKSITIPVPYFCRGAFHLEAYYMVTYDFDGRVVPDPLWEPPVWPSTFSREQAERLIDLAKRAGVFLDSRLSEVVLASIEYDEEERWCLDQPVAEWGRGEGHVFG